MVLSAVVFLAVLAIGLFGPGFIAQVQAARQARLEALGRYYPNCAAAGEAGAEDIPRWAPAYRAALDRDDDGLACESSWRSWR